MTEQIEYTCINKEKRWKVHAANTGLGFHTFDRALAEMS